MDVLRFSGVIAILSPSLSKKLMVPPMGLGPMSAIPATDVTKTLQIL